LHTMDYQLLTMGAEPTPEQIATWASSRPDESLLDQFIRLFPTTPNPQWELGQRVMIFGQDAVRRVMDRTDAENNPPLFITD
ncbi:hypothetical protein MJO29_009460, partial [Puccinia striiformis f. sp. tritici]